MTFEAALVLLLVVGGVGWVIHLIRSPRNPASAETPPTVPSTGPSIVSSMVPSMVEDPEALFEAEREIANSSRDKRQWVSLLVLDAHQGFNETSAMDWVNYLCSHGVEAVYDKLESTNYPSGPGSRYLIRVPVGRIVAAKELVAEREKD